MRSAKKARAGGGRGGQGNQGKGEDGEEGDDMFDEEDMNDVTKLAGIDMEVCGTCVLTAMYCNQYIYNAKRWSVHLYRDWFVLLSSCVVL